MEKSPFEINIYQKIYSFFYPLLITQRTGEFNQVLDFYLYKNQWQLGTREILYSDGNRYMPFRIGFEKIGKSKLLQVKECLILGAGLGSIVQILHDKYKVKTNYSIVEIDSQILKYAGILLTQKKINDLHIIHQDAEVFMNENSKQFDLICVDVFIYRYVPPYFLSKFFFERLKASLTENGIWVMNYMRHQEKEFLEFLNNASTYFKDVDIVEIGPNIVLVGKK